MCPATAATLGVKWRLCTALLAFALEEVDEAADLLFEMEFTSCSTEGPCKGVQAGDCGASAPAPGWHSLVSTATAHTTPLAAPHAAGASACPWRSPTKTSRPAAAPASTHTRPQRHPRGSRKYASSAATLPALAEDAVWSSDDDASRPTSPTVPSTNVVRPLAEVPSAALAVLEDLAGPRRQLQVRGSWGVDFGG
eukprot:m.223405 g.223405  ORF g.223405 m.223405 type:complete len:195 (+) comp10824_c0_seq6:309-893(+)